MVAIRMTESKFAEKSKPKIGRIRRKRKKLIDPE